MYPLLCLHGALATHTQFDLLLPHLTDTFSLHTVDFEGHGENPFLHGSLRAEHLVENVLAFLDANQLGRVNIFGYSLGGYVACMVAQIHPDRVERIVTLGTRYLWDAPTLERELRMADPAAMQAKVPRFVDSLVQQHPASGWEAVVTQTRNLLRSNHETSGLTEPFLATIVQPVRVIVGDRDTTAGVAESLTAYQAFQNGQLEVFPATPDPFQKVNMVRLAAALKEFLA